MTNLKKKEQIRGRTNRRMPICNPTIQLVVVNLYTKFEVSILKGCGDIFAEKSGMKEKGTNTRTNRRRPIFYSTIQLVVVNLYTNFGVYILNIRGDIFDEKSGVKEKGREEQIGECPFAIPQYNLLLQTSIPNLKFLSYTVVEISLMKNLMRKKKEQI